MSEENTLPGGWASTTIGELAWVTKLAGFEFTKFIKYREMDSVRVVRGLNVGYGEFRATHFKYIDSATSDALPRSQLHGGELLIAYVGSLGTATMLPLGGCRYHLGPNVAKAVVNPIACDTKYLLYYVLSPRGQQQIHATSKAVAQSSLSMQQIRGLSVPIAPLAEQHRIVAAIEQQFTRLDAGVAALKRAQAALKRYRVSVLKAAVEGRLTEQWRAEHPDTEPASQVLARILAERRARWEADLRAKGKDPAKAHYDEPNTPDTTSLPTLPGGWMWSLIDQLSIVVRGASPRPAGDPRYFGGNIPWITVGSLTADNNPYLTAVSEFVTEDGCAASRYLEADTLLLTNSGATLGVPKITKIAGCINDGSVALLYVDYPTKLYLYYFLTSITERLRAINQGAAQPNLNTGIVKAITAPLPSIAEQVVIVSEVEQRLSVVRELEITVETQLKRANRLRQSILERAFSGQLVPQDPDDEPAALLLERIQTHRSAVANGRKPDARNSDRFTETPAQHQTPSATASIQPTAVNQGRLWEPDGN